MNRLGRLILIGIILSFSSQSVFATTLDDLRTLKQKYRTYQEASDKNATKLAFGAMGQIILTCTVVGATIFIAGNAFKTCDAYVKEAEDYRSRIRDLNKAIVFLKEVEAAYGSIIENNFDENTEPSKSKKRSFRKFKELSRSTIANLIELLRTHETPSELIQRIHNLNQVRMDDLVYRLVNYSGSTGPFLGPIKDYIRRN